jgi:hypothetical protein
MPKFVKAAAAVVAPVPPLFIGRVEVKLVALLALLADTAYSTFIPPTVGDSNVPVPIYRYPFVVSYPSSYGTKEPLAGFPAPRFI